MEPTGSLRDNAPKMTLEEVQKVYQRAEIALLADARAVDQLELGEIDNDEFMRMTMEVNMPNYAPAANAFIIPETLPFLNDVIEERLETARGVARILQDEINDYDEDSDIVGMARLAGAVATLIGWLA